MWPKLGAVATTRTRSDPGRSKTKHLQTKPFRTGPGLCLADLLPSIGELVECVSGDDVATDELHGRIALGGLLPQNGAGKHRVVPALFAEVNFNLNTHTHTHSEMSDGPDRRKSDFLKTGTELTGSSSLCVQTPLHCLCSITCLMFISTGKAMQPDAKLKQPQHQSCSQSLAFVILQNTIALN